MALEAGVEMNRCRLHNEGGRSHFMTQRFDRTAENAKLHMQSLGAIQHFDFNQAGAYSYEQAIRVMLELNLSPKQVEQQLRRATFNVIARNQDDHVKNIAFLMNREGKWNLSPAFDVAYSFNPTGRWTSQHQMSINGKRDNFELPDLVALASVGGIKKRKAKEITSQVIEAVGTWRKQADAAGVSEEDAVKIQKVLRMDLVK
jgi:serine/threonine-protein kinase HipA